jgi:uroporphyrinogen decarboxylase
MTSRQRFNAVMAYDNTDRVPYFEEGIRDEVITVWQHQGLSGKRELQKRFPSDVREDLDLDTKPHPDINQWPTTQTELAAFKKSLNPHDKKRWPVRWKIRHRQWRNRDHVLMLDVHGGFFKTMGVMDWSRFYEVMKLLTDQPALVREMMEIQGHFCARLLEHFLKNVQIDAAVFSEPIGGNEGPLMSPQMYENVVLASYQPIMAVLRSNQVETIIFQTYANARILIPSILKFGFNTLWACEVYTPAMDYIDLRKSFGENLRLIGGIDLDALRKGKAAIKKEILTKVPSLIEQGGYIPLADGRVREDISFENYCYYRELLQKVTQGG